MKIGILGGTFDPIHLGHLTLARSAQVQFSLDKVLFIPAYEPPHKRDVPSRASAEDRYEMVRLAIQREPFFEISDLEFKRKGISYSCDTIAELEKQYPQAKLYLILGKDAFQDFETWHKALEIREKVQFLVAQRETQGGKEPIGIHAERVLMPLCPIAASGIRETLAGGHLLGDQVPPAVLDYIRDHKLYPMTTI